MHRRQLLLAGLLAPLVAGAGARPSITAAAFPSVDAILKAARPAWARRQPGIDLQVDARENVDHHNAMITAIATRSHLPDVMALEISFLGRFVNSGAFEDLSRPPYNALEHRDRFVQFALAQATTRAGVLGAIPADVAPGALFFRRDLLDGAAASEAGLTRSWESYVDSGARIKAATGAFLLAHARDLKDVMIRSGLEPGQGIYVDRAGQVLIDTPRFRRAFELARRVRSEKLDAKVIAWSSEWSEALRRGMVATQFMGSWFAGHLANWLAPATTGRWRSSQLPDGAHCAWGGTFYAIPKGARHKQQAWELIRLMTLDRGMQLAAFKSQDAFPALIETHQDPFFDSPIPFLGGQRARLQWRDAVVDIKPFPLHKLDPIAQEIVDAALDQVLAGDRDIPAALGDAQALLERRVRRA